MKKEKKNLFGANLNHSINVVVIERSFICYEKVILNFFLVFIKACLSL